MNVNNESYFIDSDSLFKVDGDSAIKLKAFASTGMKLTNVNGVIYFSANDGTHGYELWRSDDTAAGTVLVKDIYAGSTSSMPVELVNVNGTLFFVGNAEVPVNSWRRDKGILALASQ